MKTRINLLLAAVMLSLTVSKSNAITVLVAEWDGGSGAATELADVTNFVQVYNANHNPDYFLGSQLVEQGAIGSYITGGNAHVLTWTAPVGNNYFIMTKWGQGSGDFDHALHYLTGGSSVTYNPGGEGPPNGLSHVSIWTGGIVQPPTGVPDGGSTVLLLGSALGALGMIRSRFRI